MSTEENKALARRFYESFGKEVYVRRIREGDNREAEAEKVLKEIFTEFYAPDCIMHATEGDRSYDEDLKDSVAYLIVCPDFKFTVEDLIAEGDKVVARWTVRGTNEGSFRGIPPTGKQIKGKGVTIKRISEGKVVEEWALIDLLSMMQQLGVVPTQ